jgi:hypothetical protein
MVHFILIYIEGQYYEYFIGLIEAINNGSTK